MLNTTNWEYDIYERLDKSIMFTATDISSYNDEINWCYRLGYIDESHRDYLFQYLNYRVQITEQAYKIRHLDNMASILRNQERLRSEKADRQAIIEVFRKKG